VAVAAAEAAKEIHAVETAEAAAVTDAAEAAATVVVVAVAATDAVVAEAAAIVVVVAVAATDAAEAEATEAVAAAAAAKEIHAVETAEAAAVAEVTAVVAATGAAEAAAIVVATSVEKVDQKAAESVAEVLIMPTESHRATPSTEPAPYWSRLSRCNRYSSAAIRAARLLRTPTEVKELVRNRHSTLRRAFRLSQQHISHNLDKVASHYFDAFCEA